MAKLKPQAITAKDLEDFVTADSDFAFEMRVLAHLRAEGFSCVHSATYRDPVTGKIRQFDIRASMDRDDSTLALAVECKNLRANHPLLLSSVPRTSAEAFHDILVYRPAEAPLCTVRPVVGNASTYRPGEMVGKKTDQVGREASSGELVGNDEATFEKLNQAVNSCQDLIMSVSREGRSARRAIVPVLVVPTGLLWQVDYGPDGLMTTSPRPIKRAALFLNHSWTAVGGYEETIWYRLSHVEMVTFEALTGIAENWFGTGGFFPA